MPRKDTFHDAVCNALIKDGWVITHDPYMVEYDKETLYVDLGAEAPIGAEKAGQKIAVEIKSFLGKSAITELERALGQYILYRNLIRRQEADRILYLAVPAEAYMSVLDVTDGHDLIQNEAIHLIIFDSVQETVDQWIP